MRPERSVLNGRVLKAGHPVYDWYVDKPSPVTGMPNPITHIDDDVDTRACRCGCGEVARGKEFLPGHDQTALHDRVKQIGTVFEFLDRFDIVRGTKPLQTARWSTVGRPPP